MLRLGKRLYNVEAPLGDYLDLQNRKLESKIVMQCLSSIEFTLTEPEVDGDIIDLDIISVGMSDTTDEFSSDPDGSLVMAVSLPTEMEPAKEVKFHRFMYVYVNDN